MSCVPRLEHRDHTPLRFAVHWDLRLVSAPTAQRHVAHGEGGGRWIGSLAKTSGSAQTTLLLLLLEGGALASGLPAIPLGHDSLLSCNSGTPRLRHRRASVHMIWGANQ